MAPQKNIADVPRNILPRLTWNSSSSRPSVTITHHPAFTTSPRQPLPQGWSPLKRRFHSPSPPSQSSRLISTSARDVISAYLVSRGTSITTPATSTIQRGNPIRHNGVYVATYHPARRAFHATPVRARDHHFDTLKFVKRLQAEGFSEEQSVAMMRVLNDIIQESIQNLTKTMVLREDSERSTYTQKVDFAKLRSELLNADSTEAQLTRSSHEKIAADLAKLNSRLRDEIGRTQASVRLDLNLEKGRIREEANSQEMRIKETETRIEQEVAGLRERVEAVKFSTLQWLMGVCTGTAALILGAWRLFM
ncbi:uncharacterized protein N7479_008206 [Penicillium vulpinum]|uniref:DUF1640 domain-containing protein n=1 Tax=Penicillium vulpinum TaxID=29845 RepID=A0A1V6RJP9_9EURO|nr:uncharacterized protein N7479_008206 [Penicillium vulpinum]KAJ5961056.1 hypothetical protein N7479_008206 [Penicillium vulpinum]OQE01738.1 hypothetical protein PENVUL_c041G02675 [Penicillium vulpinum]